MTLRSILHLPAVRQRPRVSRLAAQPRSTLWDSHAGPVDCEPMGDKAAAHRDLMIFEMALERIFGGI